MYRRAIVLGLTAICVALSPSITLAQNASTTPEMLPAGFATAPLWVSKASSVEGDALKLFSVVNNTSTTTVSGSVSFSVDGANVGSAKVSLDAGAAQIVSTTWTAVAGTHSITATFDQPSNTKGQSLSLSRSIADPLSINVAAAPPKPAVLQYIDSAVNTTSSIVGPAVSSALAAIESARQSGADYFAKQLEINDINAATNTPSISTSTAPEGEVLGTSTENLPRTGSAASTADSTPSLFSRMAYLFFDNPIIFYPLLLLFLTAILWLIPRLFSRG